jgi:fatty-acyl-CoA synthase
MAIMRSVARQRTFLEAVATTADVVDRGFTFVDLDGQESFLSFRDVVAEAGQLAGALQARGLSRGDRVALIVPDHRPFIVTFLATLTGGLVPVPMYPPLSLAKLDNWLETAKGILRTADVSAIVTVDHIRPLLSSPAEGLDALIVTWDELVAHACDPAPVDVGPDDLAFLQFTSGSTAAPRGVMVSYRNIAENCTGIVSEFLHSASEDSGVSWLPLYHDMISGWWGSCSRHSSPPGLSSTSPRLAS